MTNERLRELDMFLTEKRSWKGDIMAFFKSLEGILQKEDYPVSVAHYAGNEIMVLNYRKAELNFPKQVPIC